MSSFCGYSLIVLQKYQFIFEIPTSFAVFFVPLLEKCNYMSIKPFLKWAGGKSKLLPALHAHLPRSLQEWDTFTYIEPFVGGGAMLFFMLEQFPNINKVVVNDVNPRLVNVYAVIQQDVEQLIVLLSSMQSRYVECSDPTAQQTYFLDVRASYNSQTLPKVEDAAHFIFLNKTCFNGLYRENRKGEFNVPWGKYAHPMLCDETNLRGVADALQKVELRCGDFSLLSAEICPHKPTFIYMDPPYRPLSPTSSFSAYAKGGFNDVDQERLKSFSDYATAQNALTMQSNSDGRCAEEPNEYLDKLYSDYNIHRVYAPRFISAKGTQRGKVSELIICNYKDKMPSNKLDLFDYEQSL